MDQTDHEDQLGTCEGETIHSWGCLVTSLTMLYEYAGMHRTDGGDQLANTPPNENEWRTDNGGYLCCEDECDGDPGARAVPVAPAMLLALLLALVLGTRVLRRDVRPPDHLSVPSSVETTSGSWNWRKVAPCRRSASPSSRRGRARVQAFSERRPARADRGAPHKLLISLTRVLPGTIMVEVSCAENREGAMRARRGWIVVSGATAVLLCLLPAGCGGCSGSATGIFLDVADGGDAPDSLSADGSGDPGDAAGRDADEKGLDGPPNDAAHEVQTEARVWADAAELADLADENLDAGAHVGEDLDAGDTGAGAEMQTADAPGQGDSGADAEVEVANDSGLGDVDTSGAPDLDDVDAVGTPDVPDEMPCVPVCGGKVCGPDGCGGSCGECAAGEACEEGECVVQVCAPTVSGYLAGRTGAIEVLGDYAYALSDVHTLSVFDVSNPAHPTLLGKGKPGVVGRCLAVSSQYAFVGTDGGGSAVYDVSVPSSPKWISSDGPEGIVSGGWVLGDNRVYLLAPGGFHILDISAPGKISYVGAWEFPEGVEFGGEYYPTWYDHVMDLDSAHAYLAAVGQLVVLDLADPDLPVVVGSAPVGAEFGDYPNAVRVQWPYVYIVTHDAGSFGSNWLYVVDVASPAAPNTLVKMELPYVLASGSMGDGGIEVSGDKLYLPAGPAGLQVIDVSEPASPKLVGGYYLDSPAVSVDISDGLAWVSTGWGGIRVVDLAAEPEAPEGIDYDLPDGAGPVWKLAVKNGLAYMTGDDCLTVIDVSAQVEPVVLSTVEVPGMESDESPTLAGGLLYSRVFPSEGGMGWMTIIDVTDPTQPTIASSAKYDYYLEALAVQGSTAFLCGDEHDLTIVNVSDPFAPVEIGAYDLPDFQDCEDVDVDSGIALINGLENIIDVSDPTKPTYLGSLSPCGGDSISCGYGRAARFSSGLVWRPRMCGFTVTDISDLARPEIVGSFDVDLDNDPWNDEAIPEGLWVHGDTALLWCSLTAAASAALLQVDVSDATAPQLMGMLSDPGLVGDTAVEAGYAWISEFVAEEFALGRRTLFSKPGDAVVGTFNGLTGAQDVRISGTVAYVAGGEQGLVLVDIASEGQPEVLSVGETPGVAMGVYLESDYAYVADGLAGLQVVDVSDPGHPKRIGGVSPPGSSISAVFVDLPYAYLLDQELGLLLIVEASDPAHPTVVGKLELEYPSSLSAVHFAAGYVFVTGSNFYAVDVSDPTSPELVGLFQDVVFPRDLDLAGQFAYIVDNAAWDGGSLLVLDVSDPTTPKEVAVALDCGSVSKIRLHGYKAYVVCDSSLVVMDVSDPTQLTVVAAVEIPSTSPAWWWSWWPEVGIDVSDGKAVVAGPGLTVMDLQGCGL